MRIRVLKFGGTSLSSPELRQLAVSHIQTALAEGCAPVVVVSAMGRGGELAILDRGGSDTSSTAIGYALRAERVDIFTDVQGILTADPRIVPEARLIDALTFEQALLMASHGTKAIHPEAVKWAMKGPTPVYIRSIRDCGCWTCISDQSGSTTRGVLGIACREKDNHTGAVAL